MYTGRSKEKKVDNGIIYPSVCFLVYLMQLFNLVEIVKRISMAIAIQVYKDGSHEMLIRKQRKYAGISIDIFIILKFLLIAWFWISGYSNSLVVIVTIYLLITNLTTYFYYHIWSVDAILNRNIGVNRSRRRFINFFISLFYMIICYAYIYDVLLQKSFQVNSEIPTYVISLLYSVSNSFAKSYSSMIAIDELGVVVSLSQTVIMFVFISIILVRSFPQVNSKQ